MPTENEQFNPERENLLRTQLEHRIDIRLNDSKNDVLGKLDVVHKDTISKLDQKVFTNHFHWTMGIVITITLAIFTYCYNSISKIQEKIESVVMQVHDITVINKDREKK